LPALARTNPQACHVVIAEPRSDTNGDGPSVQATQGPQLRAEGPPGSGVADPPADQHFSRRPSAGREVGRSARSGGPPSRGGEAARWSSPWVAKRSSALPLGRIQIRNGCVFGLSPTVASIHIRAEAAPVASVAVVVAASAWWPCGFPLLPGGAPRLPASTGEAVGARA